MDTRFYKPDKDGLPIEVDINDRPVTANPNLLAQGERGRAAREVPTSVMDARYNAYKKARDESEAFGVGVDLASAVIPAAPIVLKGIVKLGHTVGPLLSNAADAYTVENMARLGRASQFPQAQQQLGMATVYHGSPHKFDAFDMNKVGTGEGAQAYGHGLYFAENPSVANEYQKQLAKDIFAVGDGSIFNPSSLGHVNVKVLAYRGDLDGAIAKAKEIANSTSPVAGVAKKDLATLESVKARGGISPHTGNTYNVDIPDQHIAKMLDWDKPLSQQSLTVKEALAKLYKDFWHPKGADYDTSELGQSIYHRIASSGKTFAEASNKLRDVGVSGIKYLDAGSRGAGNGTRNFVVFDDQIPKIIK